MKIPKSTWEHDVKVPHFSPLRAPLETDVIIIGGGLTGIAAAYLLNKAGKTVSVVEKDQIGFGASGLTTAFITQSVDTDFRDLINIFGIEKARAIVESHGDAIELIEKIIEENDIDCEFRRVSNIIYAHSEKEAEHLKKEEIAGRELGLPIKFKTDDSLGFPNFGYLELKNQAKFHPLKYLYALAQVISHNGVEIHEHVEVKKIRGRGPYELDTNHGTMTSEQVFVATYAPFNKKLFFKKAFYDSYVYELEIKSGIIPEGTYEDTMTPYHYFRIDRLKGKDRMIIGGEDHRSDVDVDNSKNFQALEEYIQKHFPNVPYKLVRSWEGPIIEPVDGIAYIGPHKDPNMYYATGFSGNGMTYSHIAGQIISDLIIGKDNRYATVYAAHRRPTIKQLATKGRDYSKEFIQGAAKNSLMYRKEDHHTAHAKALHEKQQSNGDTIK